MMEKLNRLGRRVDEHERRRRDGSACPCDMQNICYFAATSRQ